MSKTGEKVAIVGAGLVGSLLAVYLRQRGIDVTVYEKWPDMRLSVNAGGRSINLVLTKRGLRSLERVGLVEGAMKLCVPVKGRMMHDVKGDLKFQPYGRETEWNNSVSRAELNKYLMTAAETEGAHILFSHQLNTCEVTKSGTVLTFTAPSGTVTAEYSRVFGSDGGGSATRKALKSMGVLTQEVEDILPYGYKELTFPATATGDYPMERESLHIWPRGSHMLMGLADLEHSFTGTLYLANEGEMSFASLDTPDKIVSYFREYYPDAIGLAGGEEPLAHHIMTNPVGLLGTVRCAPWNSADKVLLIGDAAHAIVPFFGQGCNSGFEDCLVLDDIIAAHTKEGVVDWAAVFADFSTNRKPDADAIADLALDNFTEMRDRVGDATFLLRKAIAHRIEEAMPLVFRSRYALVVYSKVPYSLCIKAGEIQAGILEELSAGLSSVEELDMAKAEALVKARFVPFCQEHGISMDF